MSHALMFDQGERSRSRTQQHYREIVNVNTIMKKAQKSGVLPVVNQESYYAEIPTSYDYKKMLDRIISIDQKFNALPADVRSKFGNDPDQILKYLKDPKNEKEARELGLLRKLTLEEKLELGLINIDRSPVSTINHDPADPADATD